jgi:hypothetical protein
MARTSKQVVSLENCIFFALQLTLFMHTKKMLHLFCKVVHDIVGHRTQVVQDINVCLSFGRTIKHLLTQQDLILSWRHCGI